MQVSIVQQSIPSPQMADLVATQEQISTRAFWYGLLILIGILLVASSALYMVVYTLPMRRIVLAPAATVGTT